MISLNVTKVGERTSCQTPCCSHVLLPNLDPVSEGMLPTLQISEPRALNFEEDYLAEPWKAGSSRICRTFFKKRLKTHKSRVQKVIRFSARIQKLPKHFLFCLGAIREGRMIRDRSLLILEPLTSGLLALNFALSTQARILEKGGGKGRDVTLIHTVAALSLAVVLESEDGKRWGHERGDLKRI